MLADWEILESKAELTAFVLGEREANRRQIHAVWMLPLPERVAKAWAVQQLRVEEIETLPKGRGFLITLTCPDDHSRFREGDAVKLTAGDPFDLTGTLAEGMIFSSDYGRIVISARRQHLQEGQDGLVLDANTIDLTERYLRALEELETTERGRARVLPLLRGRLEPRITPGTVSLEKLRAEGFTFQQIRALEAAAGTDLCFLVQGPPGTGKTRVLARLVRLLLERKPDAVIFVTSFTHRAIENALLAILESGVSREIVFKIGDRALDARLPHAHDAEGIPSGRLSGPIVIGATPFALRTRLAEVEFDWVIADEASQMTLPLAIMAMVRADRWIFFGDDKQMPPVVQSIPPTQAVTQSVFGRLRDNGYDVMLDESFRLPPPIAAWPSDTFYGGQLRSKGEAIDRRLRLSRIESGFETILAPDPAAVFVRCRHRGSKSSSSEEAELAGAIVAALRADAFDPRQIGIVVPYRRQARLVREQLRDQGVTAEDARRIVVDTVERMQGQEREVVIVSLTTSDLEFAAAVQDFLFMPERLNVAITRPKAKLIVLASAVWLEELPETIPAAYLYRNFLLSCGSAENPLLCRG